MRIVDIYLDDFSREEYLYFLKTLIDYFYIQFLEELKIFQVKGVDNYEDIFARY